MLCYNIYWKTCFSMKFMLGPKYGQLDIRSLKNCINKWMSQINFVPLSDAGVWKILLPPTSHLVRAPGTVRHRHPLKPPPSPETAIFETWPARLELLPRRCRPTPRPVSALFPVKWAGLQLHMLPTETFGTRLPAVGGLVETGSSVRQRAD